LETKGKLLSIKIQLDPSKYDDLERAQQWLSNSFRQCYHFLMSRYEPMEDQFMQDDTINDLRAKITEALCQVKPDKENRKRTKREDEDSAIDDACSQVSDNLVLQTPPRKR
jgi:hypothetical protein